MKEENNINILRSRIKKLEKEINETEEFLGETQINHFITGFLLGFLVLGISLWYFSILGNSQELNLKNYCILHDGKYLDLNKGCKINNELFYNKQDIERKINNINY